MSTKLRRLPAAAQSAAEEELAVAFALEECLKAIEEGETDLDGLAARYPEAMEEIRPLLTIAKELREERFASMALSLEFKEELRGRILSLHPRR